MDRKLTIGDINRIKKITGLNYDNEDNTFWKRLVYDDILYDDFVEKLRFYNDEFLYWTHSSKGDYAKEIPYKWIRVFYEMGLFDE